MGGVGLVVGWGEGGGVGGGRVGGVLVRGGVGSGVWWVGNGVFGGW